MDISFRKIMSVVYLCVWIFIVVVGWFLWFFARYYLVDVWSFAFPLILGLTVGVISALPPLRAFLACFLGFFVIALWIGIYFSIFSDLILFGIICGLFAIAGAVLRRVVFRRRIEELYLRPWEWVLLIGGVIAIADYVVVPCASSELLRYHRLTIFSRFFICSLIGLFALGVYAGIFYNREYKSLMKSVAEIALGGHGVFFIYRGRFFARHIDWELLLLVTLLVIFFFVLLIGTHVGYYSRNRIADQ
jgi:hypothetical protein